MNIKPMLVIVLIAWYLAVQVSPLHAQTAGEVLKVYETLKKPERKTRLIEGAKKEGRLVFYGTLGVDASRPMLEKFRQGYPYISIDHYRSGSVGIYNRVANEARAGKHEVDIIELSAGPVADLVRGGFIDPYRSPETDSVRPEFIDPRHLWSAYHYLVVGLAYNKTFVKADEVPKTYQDLLLSRWKGRKMSLDRDAGDVFGGLLDSWGEKQGIEYFRRLPKQDVLIRSGYTLQAQLLAAGEVEIVPWSHAQRPLLMADSGAPLGITFLEPVLSKAQVLLLVRRSSHPHAAALFIDWALSEEVKRSSASISCAARSESARSKSISNWDGRKPKSSHRNSSAKTTSAIPSSIKKSSRSNDYPNGGGENHLESVLPINEAAIHRSGPVIISRAAA